ncbi:Osmosensitive K+ channel histidine kinase KdpD [Pseudonocardia sp. Ae406_Ps2]|uniref:sensor histidine kinase n=1 Tax=unclassified Pseudonocardia TaxID=2619320 RepID=UPI00094AC275|nr:MULTISPECIES: HAMP domain-containing sensor histidine kinase [unclassified Pseudonocardia]OLL97054.1 Osmosensitive K+ channel histidine kinase KdpD [Pseudonocardia sp. Ae331_Ps2]OLM05239.1 Osmosensitive K+ channel histidine kinase KdpD [Pseudonocardia sp. Ae406_Ps2]OLM26807.1 Osmosensitive K+ channel histidine kinase KdpD [Pseudonocardia sp. Ae706_Ps2]OLM33128.1 Osmosensitive K+ channel histidine kinase KdpD [Pseudonocardia sp. Ae717_Ps2]
MASGVVGEVLGPQRRARFLAGHLTDVLVVAVMTVVVVAVSRPAVVDGRVDLSDATAVLTLVAAAVGSAAAIVALVTGRLSGDPRPSWFGAALLLYGVVLLPLSALVLPQYPAGTPRLAVLTMFVISLCILVAGLRPPPVLGAWGGWALAAVGLVVGGVVALQTESPFTRMLATSPLYSVVVQSGWALVAVLFLLDGYRRPSRVRARMGLGLLIIAVSQLYRAIVPGQEPMAGLVYPSLRVLGMGVVLAALLTMALRTVTRMQDDYDQLQDTLGEASALLERATGQTAERDHELRNGLAGLAGAAQLLTTRPGGEDPQVDRMREAVLAELNRLRQMLQTPVAVDDAAADPTTGRSDAALLDFGPAYAPVASPPGADTGGEHDVGAALRTLVDLRDGRSITLDTQDDLPPVAAPESLTRQVVTNLLANCDRHAPRTPVVVRARLADEPGLVAVEVRDHGPGLPGGQEQLEIVRGRHDEAAGGSGLGLHISAQLAQEHGGNLVLRTVHAPRGCLAVLTLPVAR